MTDERWSDEFLNAMRQVTDPVADNVIGDVVERHDVQMLNRILRSLVENDEIVPDDLPPRVHEFLDETATLPDWADAQLIEQGQNTFLLRAPETVLLLFYASLPSAYASRKGAQVLHMTRRLIGRQAWRRIIETAQFLVDVMTPGGLAPQGHGIRSAQKVRLMHAAIRHYILNVPQWRDQWDPNWGKPINQEDLAGTLMTFSTLIIDRLQRFGVKMNHDEAAAYLHAWKVVGHLLGLRPDLLPVDVADGHALMHTIFRRQWEKSEAGRELTNTLLQMMEDRTPRLIRGLPHTALRYFAGDHVADLLKVRPADWTTLLLNLQRGIFALADKLDHDSVGVGRLARSLNLLILNALLDVERDRRRPPFRIPDSLRSTGMRQRARRGRRVSPDTGFGSIG
ncbi:MAG TPA: oxygenase MpaB family protein [Anaerolineae bacterium]|nr:oxygenase MpaB family protein [Anaerolineae bacterium]